MLFTFFSVKIWYIRYNCVVVEEYKEIHIDMTDFLIQTLHNL